MTILDFFINCEKKKKLAVVEVILAVGDTL